MCGMSGCDSIDNTDRKFMWRCVDEEALMREEGEAKWWRQVEELEKEDVIV